MWTAGCLHRHGNVPATNIQGDRPRRGNVCSPGFPASGNFPASPAYDTTATAAAKQPQPAPKASPAEPKQSAAVSSVSASAPQQPRRSAFVDVDDEGNSGSVATAGTSGRSEPIPEGKEVGSALAMHSECMCTRNAPGCPPHRQQAGDDQVYKVASRQAGHFYLIRLNDGSRVSCRRCQTAGQGASLAGSRLGSQCRAASPTRQARARMALLARAAKVAPAATSPPWRCSSA